MAEFNPEDHPHPGEMLLAELEELGLSQRALAHYIGVRPEMLSEICSKKTGMNATIACKLSRALGGSPRKWLEAQMNYDLLQVEKSEYESIKTLGADE